MAEQVFFSPPYVDRDHAYGRDFYWEKTGFGRVRKLDIVTPIEEVQFLDDPDLGTATFRAPKEVSHIRMVDDIALSGELREAVFAGVLMAKLQNEKVENGRR